MQREVKQKALRRLKITAGQIRGLQKMIEQEKYCIDILTQAIAIKQAISGVEDLLLKNHLSTHVIEQMRSGHEDKAIKEIMTVYKVSKQK